MVEFGEQLRKAREMKGYTQQTLADKVYVTRQTISRWESGSRCPDLMTFKMFSSELEVSTDILLSDGEAEQIVEKTSVIEKPMINNLMVALYSLVAFLCTFVMIWELCTVLPITSSSFMFDGWFFIYHALKDCLESGIFIYGLAVIILGIYTPKKIGFIAITFLILESLTDVRNAFNVDGNGIQTLIWLSETVFPYLLGAYGAYRFFWKKDNGTLARILILCTSAFGIFREAAFIITMDLYAAMYINVIYILLHVLRVLIFIAFVYQMYMLSVRRKRAKALSEAGM